MPLFYSLLWVWTLFSHCPLSHGDDTGDRALHAGLWTPGLADGYPSHGRVLEVINKNNKIILFVHTEVITNIFGIQLTTLGKKNQVRLHPC